MVAACKRANAHEFITAFPQGYHTDCGASGSSSVSGGQKQRIAIARAILHNPAILVLDEATSALDQISERVVQEALDGLMAERQRTTIVVAHRLSSVVSSDKIVVLDAGVIAEEGTHQELMAIEGGVYRNLHKTQVR